jgi:hypothetical protein
MRALDGFQVEEFFQSGFARVDQELAMVRQSADPQMLGAGQ